MEEHRLDIRADCKEKCILRLGNLHHLATVKNISFGGVLVNLYFTPPDLHTGDNCNISMNGKFLREYSCEVVRVETPDIAL